MEQGFACFSCNVRSGAVRGFKNGVPGVIIDICAGRNADAAHHCRQLVGNVIAVQVKRGNDRIFFGFEQRILQKRIGNHVFDENFSAFHSFVICRNSCFKPLLGFYLVEFIFGKRFIREFTFG